MNRVRIRLVRSPIGSKPKVRRTVTALGLRRLSSVVEHEANPAILGMVRTVSHLVAVEDAGASEAPARQKAKPRRKPAAKAARRGGAKRSQPAARTAAQRSGTKPAAGERASVQADRA